MADAAAEARMRAIFGRAAGPRFSTAEREVPREDKPPPRLWEGPIGLLDEKAEKAWEGTLSRAEQERWQKLVNLLDEAGPEMRWRAAGLVMRRELEHARKAFQVARNVRNEQFKADLIVRAGQEQRRLIEALESRLAGMYERLLPLPGLIGDVEAAYRAVTFGHQTLGRVTKAWSDSWPGAAEGRGITGYDSEENVAKVAREQQAAHERYQARQAAAQGSRPPKRASRSGKAAAEPTRPATGPLFGGT